GGQVVAGGFGGGYHLGWVVVLDLVGVELVFVHDPDRAVAHEADVEVEVDGGDGVDAELGRHGDVAVDGGLVRSVVEEGAPPQPVGEEADAVVIDRGPAAVGALALGAGDGADPQAVLVL